jgi:hypothetical protein
MKVSALEVIVILTRQAIWDVVSLWESRRRLQLDSQMRSSDGSVGSAGDDVAIDGVVINPLLR